jgi:lysophospholipase L1-like esterase
MTPILTKPQTNVTIVAFGDSITEAGHQKPDDRWPEIVRRTLQKHFTGIDIKVVNSGVGGNTSREGLTRFDRDVLTHHPQFVLFEFGNDQTSEPARHVPVAEFRQNLDLIMTRIAVECGAVAIPMTFPPIIDSWTPHSHTPFYVQQGGPDKSQNLYREATRQLAIDHACSLVDIDSTLRKDIEQQGPGSCILPDGVHLTAHGNKLVATAVLIVLLPAIEKYLTATHSNRQQPAARIMRALPPTG